MTEKRDPEPSLQFEQAEFGAGGAAGARQCAACKGALGMRYFLANEHIVCEGCSRTLQSGAVAGGSGIVRLARATALGLVAGAVGAGVWFAIAELTGYQIGLVALLVGFLVGGAVRYGAGGGGGWAYQSIAIAITYIAIAATHVPDVVEALDQGATQEERWSDSFARAEPVPKLLQAVMVFAIAAAAPFFNPVENLIGLLIIGFALFEAWRMNKRATLVIKGPFAIAGLASP